jgi:hypothetical protein
MWSWWDSLESVAKFDSFITMLRTIGVILAAGGSVVAAVATGVQYWSGGRLNHLKAQRDAVQYAEIRDALAKSQEKQIAAELALRDIQTQQRARTLTAEQRRTLIEQLEAAPNGKVQVGFIAGDAEGERFAEQLWQVLKMAGWPVSPQMPQYAGLPRTPIGISLAMNRSGKAPHGEFLQHTLRNVGIDISITNEPVSGDLVYLTVGPKPQPR